MNDTLSNLKYSRIAIVKLSALGDIVHAMVVVQFIKRHLPNSTIDWVVEEGFKDVLISNPDINKIHTVSIKRAKLDKSFKLLFQTLKKLKKLKKYDIVIDMQGLIKSAVVAKIIPSDKTFGFDKATLREGFAAFFYSDTCYIKYSENVIKRNAFLISSALAVPISHDNILNKQPFLHFNSKIKPCFLQNGKANIAFVPGASFASKIYPVEKFGQLAQALDANITLLWGNEKERLMAEKIQNIAPKVALIDKVSLDELKAIIGQMDMVIGGDTGPVHMAWALNIPSITLFGSTPSYRNTYLTNINHVIASNSSVNPNKIDKNDFSIQDIKVSEIVLKTKKLLMQLVQSNQE
ncbi:Lipopolysaccharide core heptosyltransferase I [uncultured Gammaproteobacteria bacterium]|nr:Lipopolysaccharide core heptosyltransferase I [uncultured Gammaproteobacteria bacterium]CAC9621668.1 Lipopolysaccharide core heptosyltransferase I [uncultured Gammaproteobacteria bacterium]